MKPTCLLLATSAAASAAEINLTIEIPRLDVAEYHRPYVAAWIEKPDRSHVANLAIWYDTGMKNSEGEKWLKDIRQWWRKSGRTLKFPVDGVSGPTKPAGIHHVNVSDKSASLQSLGDGEYTLVVEAAREVGGREMVRVPFKWDGKTAVDAAAKGASELGSVGIKITTK